MDQLTRSWYELKYVVCFSEKRGSEFQDFFSDIMEKCHPSDFQRVRPWGRVGDRKNDGYLRSERTLFQVYAPNEMSLNEAIAKIEEDFVGALPYWEEYFDVWTFVHNSRDGLAPDIVKTLDSLGNSHTSVRTASWGFEELRQNHFTLSEADLASVLGFAPSRRSFVDLRFRDIESVLKHIASQDPPMNPDMRPVSSEKLKYNRLSSSVHTLLTAGMQRAELVGRFFEAYHDPTYGDRIAQAFMKEYTKCKALRYKPDTIFRKLQVFAGDSQVVRPSDQAAALAILAYLFEQCDIFERPDDGAR